jgi:hypothetical protein
VSALFLLGAILPWLQWRNDNASEHDKTSPRANVVRRIHRNRKASSSGLRRWQLWTIAIASAAMAAGLAGLARLGSPQNINDVTAVLIVAGGLITLTIALSWRAAANTVEQNDVTLSIDRSKVGPRQLLLEKVDNWWIRDGLHRSLQQAVQLEVGLNSQPDALANRFDEWATGGLQRIGAGDPLPSGTSLAGLLKGHHHWRCLVIGDPGSGKTTHLLQLAEHLLKGARRGATAPIPVVLLLSRWIAGTEDLVSWVSAEISNRYDIIPSQVEAWLTANSFILLLDGLDEVNPAFRSECINALNIFCKDSAYAGIGLVLTCRTHDYESLQKKLRFDTAVSVRPLIRAQVDQALTLAGPSMDGLRRAHAIDNAVAELLTTPLMLGLAILAYRGAPQGSPIPEGNPERIRSVLYEAFVNQMLSRDRSLRPYASATSQYSFFDQQKVRISLIWLAKMMMRQQQTVIYPDWMTPAWLPDRFTDWPLPRNGSLTWWFACRLGWDHTSTALEGGRLAAIVGACVAAPIGALAGGAMGALLAAAAFGIILGSAVILTFGILLQIPKLEGYLALAVGSREQNPYAASAWSWSWPNAIRGLLTRTALSTAVVGTILGILLGWSSGALIALVLGFGSTLSAGAVPDLTEPPTSPGKALSASLWVFTRLLLLLMLVSSLAAVAAFMLGLPWTGIVASLPLTVALMLTAGPGRAWLRTRAVHYGMTRSGLLPRDLTSFLMYADERVIMQRTFGGFSFVHRTLRDYLAHQVPTQGDRQETGQIT